MEVCLVVDHITSPATTTSAIATTLAHPLVEPTPEALLLRRTHLAASLATVRPAKAATLPLHLDSMEEARVDMDNSTTNRARSRISNMDNNMGNSMVSNMVNSKASRIMAPKLDSEGSRHTEVLQEDTKVDRQVDLTADPKAALDRVTASKPATEALQATVEAQVVHTVVPRTTTTTNTTNMAVLPLCRTSTVEAASSTHLHRASSNMVTKVDMAVLRKVTTLLSLAGNKQASSYCSPYISQRD